MTLNRSSIILLVGRQSSWGSPNVTDKGDPPVRIRRKRDDSQLSEPGEIGMKSQRSTALIVGVLFIIGTVSGVLGGVFTGQIFGATDYLGAIAANQSQFITGTIFVLVMGFSLVMVPAMLYPVFRKYNRALALGAVLFRGALEGVTYMLIALCWLALFSLSRASGPDPAIVQFLSDQVRQVETWANILMAIPFCLGALMIYYLFYTSRLIPRWLSLWGFIGAILYIIAPIIVMFNSETLALSLDTNMGILMGPLALQEMVFALWLIFKGFNPSPVPAEE